MKWYGLLCPIYNTLCNQWLITEVFNNQIFIHTKTSLYCTLQRQSWKHPTRPHSFHVRAEINQEIDPHDPRSSLSYMRKWEKLSTSTSAASGEFFVNHLLRNNLSTKTLNWTLHTSVLQPFLLVLNSWYF